MDYETNKEIQLINSEHLNTDLVKDKDLVIVGDFHSDPEDIGRIVNIIELVKPDYVLVEMLGDYVLNNMREKVRVSKLPIEEHYYQDLTKTWIDISLNYKIPFIGIEYTKFKEGEYDKLGLAKGFAIREKHFIKMIESYRHGLGLGSKRIVAIVGDTHLRMADEKLLGGVSPISIKYNNKSDSVVIRSEFGEIE